MPPVVVTAFALTSNGKIQAATYGRGVYEISISGVNNQGDYSLNSDTNSQTIGQGEAVNFTVRAQGVNGYTLPINLSATVSPANSTLNLSFTSVSITPGGNVTFRVATTGSTPPGTYSITISGNSSGLIRNTAVNVVVTQGLPKIEAVEYSPPKLVLITGSKFSTAPRVFINGVDRSEYLKKAGDTSIKLKGKANKLGLVTGNNTIQVVDASGQVSNTFTLRL